MDIVVDSVTDGVVRVDLRGRLDSPTVDAIETRLTASLVPRGDSAIVDLSGVEFVGSMAIRMFLSIAKALDRKGRRLVLFAPQPAVAEVFGLASLDALIPVARDAAGALDRARS
jgi:anti-anti-sigma factor